MDLAGPAVDGAVTSGKEDLAQPGTGSPVLVDGPASSRIPGWDATNPAPVLVLAHRVQPSAWVLGWVIIGTDGSMTGLVNVDRVRVFGFSSGATLAYDGPLSGAHLAGWSATAPEALIILGRPTGQSTWVVGADTIDASGNAKNILAVDRVRVWRFAKAPVVRAAIPGAKIPGWNATSPGPIMIAAGQTGSTDWTLGGGSVADDGTLGDLAAAEAIAWSL